MTISTATGGGGAGASDAAPSRVSHDQDCDVFQEVLELVGRRWMGVILFAGARGAQRFSEYRRFIGGISDRMLSQRLKELESLGLLEREVVPTTPVQILYRPSPRGRGLLDALEPLVSWGHAHREDGSAAPEDERVGAGAPTR
ncbi:winged helix-turn-helix transcriptional regulator [Streptomonospora litoralis]|uniref:winged helix-turn-helix transcriptional regulator n=1 Tax=Streptomonospora litoralis TaxID=2498135 RepID=UPI001A9553D8|nr:helix-turn-helix domain-containing protein [Streptomonospora litoralis]